MLRAVTVLGLLCSLLVACKPDPSGGAKQTVGPKGATITFQGVTLTIPEGALAEEKEIVISAPPEGVPGYTLYSPAYRFEPAGLTFAKPATLRMAFEGDPLLAVLFLSRQGTSGYERLGGATADGAITAPITHFSTGFVADGVDYTDPADRSCVVTRLVEGRASAPSNVGLFFTVDDCQGRPITGLVEGDFALEEDGVPLSAEAGARVLPQRGLEVFVTLLIDMSSSARAELPGVINGAKAFVRKVQVEKQLPVQIGIQVFAGQAPSLADVWMKHSLDTAALEARLEQLPSYAPADPGSTNLYGAMVDALGRLHTAQKEFRTRNYGGALTTGYLVVFSDGRDTASRTPIEHVQYLECTDPSASPPKICFTSKFAPEAAKLAPGVNCYGSCSNGGCCDNLGPVCACGGGKCYCAPYSTEYTQCESPNRWCPLGSACQGSGSTGSCCCTTEACRDKQLGPRCDEYVQAIGVAVAGADLDPAALAAIAPHGVYTASDPAQLDREFGALANQIAGQMKRVYLLAYCSPKRTGTHTVAVSVKGSANQQTANHTFSAAGFAPGCSAETMATSCDTSSAECGGLACGACDDRTSACSPTTWKCADFCVTQNKCGGTVVTNPNGYQQTCNDLPERYLCGAVCVDTSTSMTHCGACGSACTITGASCVGGACKCPSTQIACSGACVDSDTRNCGSCGVACATGASCVSGVCQCPGTQTVCSGACVDTSTSMTHCGACGAACGAGEACNGGVCGPDSEWANWPVPANAPAPTTYTTTADTVTDTVTGLVWQRNISASTFTWTNAKSYCKTLNLGGQSGWRLPTLIELESIVNYGKYAPAFDTTVFLGVASSVWSSSPGAYNASYAWVVDFSRGSTGSGSSATGLHQVRCVR